MHRPILAENSIVESLLMLGIFRDEETESHEKDTSKTTDTKVAKTRERINAVRPSGNLYLDLPKQT